MVKCRDCRKEMVFRQLPDRTIVLVCPDPKCNFQSEPIPIDNADQLGETEGSEGEKEFTCTDGILHRNGPIEDYIIFCLDISSRMDVDIPFDEKFARELRDKIQSNPDFPDDLKEKLLDLLMPPISFFRAAVLSLALFLIENLQEMTRGAFTSFQVITMAGEVDEVFRFPNFKEQATFGIVMELIDILFIKRKEYRKGDLLSFRTIIGGMRKISTLLHELRDIAPEQEVKITFMTIGEHRTPDNQFINPLRSCMSLLGNLGPFTVNVIDLNINGRETIFKPLTKHYNGTYSKENTLTALHNAIILQRYGSDPVRDPVRIRRLEQEARERALTKVEKQPPKQVARSLPPMETKPRPAPKPIQPTQPTQPTQAVAPPSHPQDLKPVFEPAPAKVAKPIPATRAAGAGGSGEVVDTVIQRPAGRVEESTIPRDQASAPARQEPKQPFTFITKPSQVATIPAKPHPSISPSDDPTPKVVEGGGEDVQPPPVMQPIEEPDPERRKFYKELGISENQASTPGTGGEKAPEIQEELFDIGADYFKEKEEDIKVSKPEESDILLHRGADDIIDKMMKKSKNKKK